MVPRPRPELTAQNDLKKGNLIVAVKTKRKKHGLDNIYS